MTLEDIAHRLVRHRVPEVRQRTLDPVVSPGGILTSKPQNKLDDLFLHTWPADRLAAFAVIPFLGHELSMPAQDRIGCDDGGQFHQGFSAQCLGFDGQESALIVGQQKPLLPLCFQQSFNLQLVELDDLLLLALDPADKDHDEELPGLKNEGHGSPVLFEENRQHRG